MGPISTFMTGTSSVSGLVISSYSIMSDLIPSFFNVYDWYIKPNLTSITQWVLITLAASYILYVLYRLVRWRH